MCYAELAGKGVEIFSGYRVSDRLDKLYLAYLKLLQFVFGYLPKTGVPCNFGAKNRYIQNQVRITRQEPCDWPAAHRTRFWLPMARYTWCCLLF